MVSPAGGVRRRPDARRRPAALVAAAALVAVLALVLAAGYGLGLRLNLQTGPVPVPPASASPEEVVRTYVEAYDRRDLATTAALYPAGQGAVSRFRAMGTMRIESLRSRTATEADLAGTFPQPGHAYARVEVTLDQTGLTGSDLALDDGPGGRVYWLERATPAGRWTITDEGF